MIRGRKVRSFLLISVVLTMAFAMAPAPAAAGLVCQVAGTVTLNTGGAYENLIRVNGGSGTVTGTVVCEGGPSGAFPISGSFSFCGHQDATHTGCSATPDTNTSPLEPAYNAVSSATAATGSPIVTDIVADMSFGGCSWNLEGHSLLILADLRLDSFHCGTTYYTTFARAQATAAPIIIPGGLPGTGVDCAAPSPPTPPLKLCFNQLAIVGSIEAAAP